MSQNNPVALSSLELRPDPARVGGSTDLLQLFRFGRHMSHGQRGRTTLVRMVLQDDQVGSLRGIEIFRILNCSGMANTQQHAAAQVAHPADSFWDLHRRLADRYEAPSRL